MTLQNIDQADKYEKLHADLRLPTTRNFVVLFDTNEASCTRNVPTDEVSAIVHNRQREGEGQSCLWLNLWGWDDQHEEIIKTIAKHYDLSPRLTHFLSPRPSRIGQMEPQQQADPKCPTVPTYNTLDKLSVSAPSDGLSLQAIHPRPRMPTSIADIASDLWHFCTVDYGRRYVCICWNALFFLPDEPEQNCVGKPNAIRVWSSVLLCDDGTVVSTFESPRILSLKAKIAIRQNQLNIFTHLSKYGALCGSENALMQINIRPFNSSARSSSVVSGSGLASSLFYYLFDDWVNIYYQAVGGPHSYRNQLESLRQSMINSAKVEQVTKLHHIGRELSVLRAIYQSYQSIIERIVQRHRRAGPSTFINSLNGCSLGRSRSMDYGNICDINELPKTNVKLTTSDVGRFERLQDRIALCAITEVDECIKEKDDLVMMVSPSSCVPSFTSTMLTSTELQPRLPQGISSCREAHTYHRFARQSHHTLSARLSDNRIL